MKFQIVLVLAVAACAFAEEVTVEPTLAIDDVKIEANDDDKIKVENDSAESKVEILNEKPDEEKVSSDEQKVSSDEQKVSSDEQKISSDEQKVSSEEQIDVSDIKGPIIFEWTSVYRNHDIDVAVPVDIDWPSNLLDFLNTLHGDGLEMVPKNDDFDINLAFPTAL